MLARALLAAGSQAEGLGHLHEAIELWSRLVFDDGWVTARTGLFRAHMDSANVLMALGRGAEAIGHVGEAEKIRGSSGRPRV